MGQLTLHKGGLSLLLIHTLLFESVILSEHILHIKCAISLRSPCMFPCVSKHADIPTFTMRLTNTAEGSLVALLALVVSGCATLTPPILLSVGNYP